MKIAVVDFAASKGGATSILQSFYQYLIDSNDENEWYFLLSGYYISETPNIKIVLLTKEKESRLRRLAFDYIYGRKVIKRINPDAVFYLQNTFIHGVKCKQIAYMDQSIPFQNTVRFSFFDNKQRSLAVYQFIIGRMIKAACKRADSIIVQTEWMRRAISEQCRVDINRIKRIPPDINTNIPNDVDSVFFNQRFFYPASAAYYKNHRCIVKAVSLLNEQNITDFSVHFTISGSDISGSLPNQIICSGGIPHDDVLREMGSETLIFPSYIETFGLPLAEARELKTIILAADTEFSQEVLNGYENAYFFDPFNPEELANLMKSVIEGKIIRRPVIEQDDDSFSNIGWGEAIKVITKV